MFSSILKRILLFPLTDIDTQVQRPENKWAYNRQVRAGYFCLYYEATERDICVPLHLGGMR